MFGLSIAGPGKRTAEPVPALITLKLAFLRMTGAVSAGIYK